MERTAKPLPRIGNEIAARSARSRDSAADGSREAAVVFREARAKVAQFNRQVAEFKG
jgi:hypothetical protein